MNNEDVLNYFNQIICEEPEVSAAIAAIRTLIEFIKLEPADTLAELRTKLLDAIKSLTNTDNSVTSISSGCDLFLRFITLASLDYSGFEECKNVLIERGNLFLQKMGMSRAKLVKLAFPFITDGVTILTHSRSRVVLEIFKEAAAANKRFNVFVTESMPDGSGHNMCKDLIELGIPATLILDAAVGMVMEKTDFVMVGAEGVVENGGIINKIGTYTISLSAKELNKPFYVVSECFKFVRLYPLNQRDIPNELKYPASKIKGMSDLMKEHPLVDYTPPSYITLLFTDLGILTPSAISDELIKLYGY